jgi:hypothetical protein
METLDSKKYWQRWKPFKLSSFQVKKEEMIKTIGVSLSFLISANAALAYAPEANIWKDRQKSVLASLPGTSVSPDPKAILQKLPPLTHTSQNPNIPSALLSSRFGPEALSPLLTALPSQFGSVRKILVPKAGHQNKTVVHILDIHANAEAQTNISKTVQNLLQEKKLHKILLEGDSQSLPISNFRTYPNQDAVRQVVDVIFRDNKISGPIHAALVSKQSVPGVIGIDDARHHAANVQAYQDASRIQSETKKDLLKIRQSLEAEKRTALSPSVRALDDRVNAHRSGKISFGANLKYLAAQSSDVSFNAQMFLEAMEMEAALDFARVESERTGLITALMSKMSEKQAKTLLDVSVAYRMGRIRHTDFYRYLRDLCSKTGVDLVRYKSMDGYIRYVLLSDSIDAEGLFAEALALEKRAFEKIVSNDNERTLVAKDRRLYLTERLIDFGMTKEEWKEYKSSKSSFPNVSVGNPVSYKSKDSGSPIKNFGDDDLLKPFEKFYTEADARDGAMASRVSSIMNDSSVSTVVLVTGGYHQDGLQSELLNSGITVVNFVPRLTAVDAASGTAYLSVFNQEKTPLDKLFEGQKLFLASSNGPGLRSAVPPIVGLSATSGDATAQLRQLAPNSDGLTAKVVKTGEKIVITITRGTKSVVTVLRTLGGKLTAIEPSKPAINLRSPSAIWATIGVLFAGLLTASAQTGTGALDSLTPVSGWLVAAVTSLVVFRKQAWGFIKSLPSRGMSVASIAVGTVKSWTTTVNPFDAKAAPVQSQETKPSLIQKIRAQISLPTVSRKTWIQIGVGVVAVAALYFVLPVVGGWLSAWAAGLNQLGALALWQKVVSSIAGGSGSLFWFAGKVTVVLLGAIAAVRLSFFYKPIGDWAERTKSGVQAWEQEGRQQKGLNKWMYKAKHLPIGLGQLFYSFGLGQADRLFKILMGQEVLDQDTVEKLYASRAPPLALRIALLPIFATLQILRKRLILLVLSSIAHAILFNTIGTLADFNLFDMFMGSEWTQKVISGGGLTGEFVRFMSPFGYMNSILLAVLMMPGDRYTNARRYENKSRWQSLIELMKSPFVRFPQYGRVNGKIKKIGEGRMWSRSIFGRGLGIHAVGLEIAALVTGSHYLGSPIHGFVMKVESDQGVLGFGTNFAQSVMAPFQTSPLQTGNQVTSRSNSQVSSTEIKVPVTIKEQAKFVSTIVEESKKGPIQGEFLFVFHEIVRQASTSRQMESKKADIDKLLESIDLTRNSWNPTALSKVDQLTSFAGILGTLALGPGGDFPPYFFNSDNTATNFNPPAISIP